jgi:hypothetical protein
MSQSYHCQLQQSVTVTVAVGDTVTHSLNLTEILPREEMVALLREQLIGLGFVPDGDTLTLVEDGTTTVVDLAAMEVTISRASEKELSATATVTGRGYTRSAAKASAEQTAAVESADSQVKEVLHLALQQVYTESLKRKAAQLGDVLSVHESTSETGEYELVIKIEQ